MTCYSLDMKLELLLGLPEAVLQKWAPSAILKGGSVCGVSSFVQVKTIPAIFLTNSCFKCVGKGRAIDPRRLSSQ